jgi:outer membrane protein OmpA-like peptidoglycan-associated protein
MQEIYTATGGDEFIVIGNFQSNFNYLNHRHNIPEEEIENKNRTITNKAYYYIDDVSLTPISDETKCSGNINSDEQKRMSSEETISDSIIPDSIKVNEPVILNNIHFKLDKATLLPASYTELNKFYQLMQRNSGMEIKIAGDTDSTGTEAYNKELSMKRAQAVAEYLSEKGIDTSRVSYKGYGNTRPIATDSTEAGRAKNRRVEFIIKKR